MGFPYKEYLYPGALDAVRKARGLGQVAVLSEGDATFQPHKIWRTGLDPEVDGNVLVFDHKLDHLDEMLGAFPADHYVLVEDKPSILAAVKQKLGPRVTTVLLRQGAYREKDPIPPRLAARSGLRDDRGSGRKRFRRARAGRDRHAHDRRFTRREDLTYHPTWGIVRNPLARTHDGAAAIWSKIGSRRFT